MEHEVYVPFPVGSVRAALAESERVTRCVPGLQPDAGAAEDAGDPGNTAGTAPGARPGSRLTGRMRVRIGGSTITYRGSLALTPRDGGAGGLDAAASGSEARGGGEVELSLTVVAEPSEDGESTRLICTGTFTGTGRIAGFEERTATSAGHRLLDRFGSALADSISEDPPPGDRAAGGGPAGGSPARDAAGPAGDTTAGSGEADVPVVPGGIGEPGDNERVIPGIPEPESSPDDTVAPGEADTPEEHDPASGPLEGAERAGLFETEIPPSSLEAESDDVEGFGPGAPAGAGAGPAKDPLAPDEPLGAEAAHARRTMIGRSAEEVDHAPPRGRYAPVPAPETAAAVATLRWAAPAAAVVVAGAVVIGRVLRRRR